MIVGKNGAWNVKSEDGSKHLGGPYKTKKEAEDRLKQVEYFKAHPKESTMEKPIFIDALRGIKAILAEEKFLVTDKDGTGHLPVDDARHMGAAWAALHGGYRGEKYEGPDKSKAIAKLKAMYKAKGMDAPSESHALTGGEFFQEALAKDDSFDSLRCKVQAAINSNIEAGTDMDGDDDGPQDAIDYKQGNTSAWVQDMFPGYVVYSMEGCLYQCGWAIDTDGDVHLGPPEEVQLKYDTVQQSMHAEGAFEESYAGGFDSKYCQFLEAAYDGAKGQLTMTVIRPGLSKNNRYYSPELLKKSAKIFEGARMFADHYTDKQSKDRPEGSIRDWVGSLTKVWPEKDGTIKATAVVIDPAIKAKLEALKEAGLLGQMGVSIRAAGTAVDGEHEGKKVKVVESLDAARSVDFVTFAGAGGAVESL